MTLTIILSVLFFILMYAVFDGLQTVIADAKYDNIISEYCGYSHSTDTNYPKHLVRAYVGENTDWYDGSNKDYSPSWFWTSNPWHMAKWGRLYSLSAAIGIALTPVLHWYSLLFPLIAHIEGVIFIVGYHRIFRTGDTRLTWPQVLTHIIPGMKVKR